MNSLVVNADQGRHRISRHVYGHFAEHLGRCIYDGFWVGEESRIPNVRGIRSDVVEALRQIGIPNLRWPGGCFADEYHWRDGIGPREQRPRRVNSHWGMVTENNHFGTHEYMDLCGQLGCDAYICGNVGSGTVREMQQWVEYLTFGGDSTLAEERSSNGREGPWTVPFWGVGNENWGCGGRMTAESYADAYRRYATYVRNYSENRICKVACGPAGADYHWTEELMRKAGRLMHALALHYYCRTGRETKSATEFGEADWFGMLQAALRMDELLTQHIRIMDRYDPEKKVALFVDEWGAWHAVEPGTNPGFLFQQNTLRDALVAGVTLNVFNNHCDRVRMTNLAQTVNVLQAMILTEGEKMLLTPTYHVFEMYKVHHDALGLPVWQENEVYAFGEEQIPAVHASASRSPDGTVHVSLCNTDPHASQDVSCRLHGMKASSVQGRVLTAGDMHAHNTFENPVAAAPVRMESMQVAHEGVHVRLPPASVAVLAVR